MKTTIRLAETDEEKRFARELRYMVHVEEMQVYLEHANHEERTLEDADDNTGRFLIAYEGDEPVGILRMHWGGDAPFCDEHREAYDLDRFSPLLEPSEMLVATRLMLRKQARGGPATLQLIHGCVEFAALHNVNTIFCDCQPHLISMYRAIAGRPYHRAFNDPSAGILIPLVLVGPDKEYSKHIGSPLASLYEKFESRVPLEDILSLIPETPSIRTMSSETEATLWQEVQEKLTTAEAGRGAFLAGLDEEQIEVLFRHGHVLECDKGDFVIGRGQVTRTMFLVLDGVLEVKYEGRVVNVLTRGDCAGEIAFLHEVPRSADIYAVSEDVRLLSLSESSVRKLLESDPLAGYQLMLNLAKSLAKKLIDREGF